MPLNFRSVMRRWEKELEVVGILLDAAVPDGKRKPPHLATDSDRSGWASALRMRSNPTANVETCFDVPGYGYTLGESGRLRGS